jgi:hypothetical protein
MIMTNTATASPAASGGGSNPRMILNEEEPGDGAEWLMISLTASSSRRDEIFGRDTTKEGFA